MNCHYLPVQEGGVLGTTLLGWKHVGYVEKEEYCQKVIIQRIKDGMLDEAPIFGDIRSFIRDGYAAGYKGMVDVLTAGFPCQPFSVAGKQKGKNDARNMWPETIECIRIIRPPVALLENVPGLLAHGYIRRIFGDLAESGYNARWCVLGANDVGAPHRRKRVWILANSNGIGGGSWRPEFAGQQRRNASIGSGGSARNMADTCGNGRTARRQDDAEYDGSVIIPDGEYFSHSNQFNGYGSRFHSGEIPQLKSSELSRGEKIPDADLRRCGQLDVAEKSGEPGQSSGIFIAGRRETRWPAEPDVGRVAHGVASRVDRLKAIGNGQVPAVVARVWELLSKEI